jgi:ATP-dependent Clp protease ATP-binding subunit ClpA
LTFEIFTNRARRAVLLAEQEAAALGSTLVRPEHLLLGLLAEGEGVAWIELRRLGAEIDVVRQLVDRRGEEDQALEELTGLDANAIRARFTTGDSAGRPVLDRRSRRALWAARAEAALLHHRYVGTEHLLLGLTSDDEDSVCVLLEQLGIDRAELRANVTESVAPQQVRLERALTAFFGIRATLNEGQEGQPVVEEALAVLNRDVLGLLNDAYVDEELKAGELADRVEQAVALSHSRVT